MRFEPFPFDALPRVSREEASLGRRLRRAARRSRLVRPEAIGAALEDLVGEPVSISLRKVQRLEPNDHGHVFGDGIGLAFAAAEAPPGMSSTIAIVDGEPALASALVARALKQRAPRLVDPARPTTPEIAGALAAVIHGAARRAHAEAALRVIAAGPTKALARDLASAHSRVATAWLAVSVGKDAYAARVTFPIDALATNETADRPFDAGDLAGLGDAPLGIPLVGATCIAGRSDLEAIRTGDVFIIPSFPLHVGAAGGHLEGSIAIASARAERGIKGDLAPDGRLVLRTSSPLENLSWDRVMSSSSDQNQISSNANATLEVLEDAPVVVRVELGVVEMKAREWAELGAGDVISLGRKVGDPASLRVGGVEIARGELVVVDGEYGVRILSTTTPR